ncbi:trifunctional serine/threonine-protein kinase/ATP-binding protein/sensor histidine kinase [Dapis sp. BLCC M126]|uniref:trifunctional serine/threonine-protein kinase/ATP-binding protein/sensor histidine kinase n=1 Tax=Dapis sp. BLCC M126 TaxID=3400189 RepID=UPI003CEC8426
MSKTKTITIANYQARELIHKSERTLVYRGQNVENGQLVMIKLMRNQYPTFRELVQFRNQYAISKNLEIEGIIKTYALQRYENRYALIMEDVGGISLAEYEEKSSFSIPQFLDIAIQLSEILHQLHNNSIIHKDIKPANILIHPETKQVKLIDFSISTLLAKETQTIQTPNVLEGTLAYLSPEQTGRMNRAVDYRSDFYSLGVTFYELLKGDLPFRSDDALELIHAHIALSPEPLSGLVVLGGDLCPPTLSDIVLKLMAKNGEERYQSALGLKYDLEKCRSQYQERGKIESFELGERDLCDRFIIPEKLYGREKEVQVLLDVFEGVANPPPTPLSKGGGRAKMMLVAGFSGIGKTAVINEVHKPIVKQRGYFVKGKFDQFNRNIPFSAFVQAFRNLMGQLLGESNAELQGWKTQILEALGNNGQVLIDVIPELERVIGKQSPVPELSGSAAQNRFNLLFEKFIAVFTTKEHPLVIFLDDLQWADSASLNLIKVLMGNNNAGYLLLLGAYRDNEVFPAHPLMLTLAEIEKQKAAISTITLAPLSVDHINQLVVETLSCQVEQSEPLTELVYQKTQGNPFFTTQFLKGLYEDKLIVFNANLGYWECDLVKVRDAALTNDVVEFMAGRLQKLPVATQEVLKLAACIGNQFELETLAVVCETPSEEMASELWAALQERMILPTSEAYKFFQGDIDSTSAETVTVNYRFLHDRVQQAAYSLIPKVECAQTHLKIGWLLLENATGMSLKSYQPHLQSDIKNLFNIVNQLNLGADLLEDRQEKETLSYFNLQAGRKAKISTAYTTVLDYSEQGLALLDDNPWTAQYNLCLSLTELAAEAAYLCGDFQRMSRLVAAIRDNARTLLDRIKADEIEIQGLMACCQFSEEMEAAYHVLQLLGVELPKPISPEDINSALARVRSQFGTRPIASLETLPDMDDPEKNAAMRVLLAAIPAAYIINPSLFLLMVLQQMSLSLEYGNSAISSFSYAAYGIVRCGIEADVTGGYEFGILAIEMLKARHRARQAPDLHAIVTYVFHTFLSHWCVPLRESISGLKQVYLTALESGDLQHAALSSYRHSQHLMYVGCPLVELKAEAELNGIAIERTTLLNSLSWNDHIRQFAQNFMGETTVPWVLSGDAYDEVQAIKKYRTEADRSGLHFIYHAKLLLNYFFARYDEARENSNLALEYIDSVMASAAVPVFYFYDSLVHLALCQTDNIDKAQCLERADSNQIKMQMWAESAPTNYRHKFHLVAAERHRVEGKYLEAIEQYDRTITGAKENEYIQEEALANELFAKFYLDWSREKEASVYMQEAYYCYAQWGAKAKTDDLEQRYPQLLKPILQRDQQSLYSNTSISKITSNSYSQTATVANISSILDFSSLLKASQTLSGEIELDRLLSTLMKIIIENAGATKGALLLTGEQGLTVEAIATRIADSSNKLTIDSLNQSIPLEDSIDLPVGLINYVRRTTQTALLDAQAAQEQFAADSYLLRFHPQSLLCMPLQERGKFIGILYLENRLTTDAFTNERLEILDTLCAQAAISLENARLYQQSQQALKDLQEAQLQLVQNEKMVTLGNLVAGVAHEINNPVGFIGGNISMAQEYLQDLLTIVSLYQENTSLPESIIVDIEALEPEFIAEDFPKLMASMQEGCARIANISTSLRTFSRTDTINKTEFNLHDGIDSTLLILKYRLKANENRPAIEVVKNYGKIPPVKCYAGQLNQVFMNLLANAIDALDESNAGKTFQEIEKEPNRITIKTELRDSNNSVIVQISDNGVGIPEEVKAKIFEQGFTTKVVGKGTGLGMAIAHQIVTEKHGGKIICNSTVGEGTIFTIVIPR